MNNDIVESINDSVSKFKDLSNTGDHRYLTFDYCYNYFHDNKDSLGEEKMEMSCYVLWSYLSSWGMLRGSTFLLQKNPKFLVPLIELIGGECKVLFNIDVDKYTKDNITTILDCYEKIKAKIKDNVENREASIILITKIMLGVFGCIPAYDGFFKKTFNGLVKTGEICGGGFSNSKLSPKSLESIYEFYQKYQAVIDLQRKDLYTKDFTSGNIKYQYPIAKVIDMYGFQDSLTRSKK